jgi:hypothetical protein
MSGHSLPPAVRLASKKFDSAGKPQVMPGNTIMWHLPKQEPVFKAMVRAQQALAQGTAARCLALLPPASFHLTLFEGCLDRVRTRQAWPRDLPLNEPMVNVNAFMSERLSNFDLECALPIRFRFAAEEVVPHAAHFEVVPDGHTEEVKLLDLRERLAQALGLWHEDHAHYRFHVTVAYICREFSGSELEDFQNSYLEIVKQFRTTHLCLELYEPEFCIFSNMTHFAPQFHLPYRSKMLPVRSAQND